MRTFAVSALGPDRPGIVAAVTGVVSDFAMNVEDARGAILRGHFSVTLLVSGGDHVEVADLQRALDGVREELGLEATVAREVSALEDVSPFPTHVATVPSHERPGILLAVSTVLARAGVTVTSLGVLPREGEPVLSIEVAVPDSDVADEVAERLAAIGQETETEIEWGPARAAVA